METSLKVGDAAPDFTATAVGGEYGEGTAVTLSQFRGVAVVLYFYPKDGTPGCTAQACGMRDRWERLRRPDTVFFGVSSDTASSHQKFIAEHALPFPLISDSDHAVAEAYGVWVEKTLYGRTFLGTERTTFVVRPNGRIKSIYRKVAPNEHADILFQDLANFEP